MSFADFVLLTTLLVWVPLIPLRLWIQAGSPFWKKWGDLSYLAFFVYWIAVDLFVYRHFYDLIETFFTPNFITRIVGVLVMTAALAGGYWTIKTLGFVALSLRPQLSPAKKSATLVIFGPYRRVRHPLYLMEWVLLLGCLLITGDKSVVVLLIAALVIDPIVTLYEERDLAARFGDEYRRYQKSVPRLIPNRLPSL